MIVPRKKGLGGEWAVRPVWKVMGSLVLATASGLLLAPPASAALCARWDPPRQVDEGTQALVSFRTFLPISENGDAYRLKPHAFPDYPFRVQAISPRGEPSRIAIAPSADDNRRWLGSLTPNQEGRWTLTIVNMQGGGDEACYTDATLMVKEGARSRLPILAVLGLVVILGCVVSYLLIRRRSRPKAGTPD